MDVRVLAFHHISHDGAQGRLIEAVAVDAAADAAEREHRVGVTNQERVAVAQAEAGPRRLGQPRLVDADETVRDLVKGGDGLPLARAQEDA